MFNRMIASLLLIASGFAYAQLPPSTVWPLTAGQHTVIGTVEVTNDMDNLYVTYNYDLTAHPQGYFNTLHLWVGNDLFNVPRSGGGAPIPGQFPWQHDAAGASSYTFTIPFLDLSIQDVSQACGLPLYVFTHAEAMGVSDGSGGTSGETAWGGDTDDPTVNRWYFYGTYNIQCGDGPEEPELGQCETAYGMGNWVWTTSRRSNPDNMPSLELTKNRWGWAYNITEPGVSNSPIYAGAGLNKTSKGTQVGELVIDFDGTSLTVSYLFFSGVLSEEFHTYVGDTAPDTIAPGQYGANAYYEGGTGYHSQSFDVSDTDGDGVWVVAHSVACPEL